MGIASASLPSASLVPCSAANSVSRCHRRLHAASSRRQVAKYVSDLEPQVVNVHKHTEAFVRRGRELANCLFEFGLAFKLLGQCENDVLGGSLTKLGETSDSLSVMTAEEAEKEALSFEQPLQDYIRVIGAVKNALSKRDERRATWEAAVADLEAKQAWHAKLVQTPGKASKADDAQRDVIHAQNRVDETKADFDKARVLCLRSVFHVGWGWGSSSFLCGGC